MMPKKDGSRDGLFLPGNLVKGRVPAACALIVKAPEKLAQSTTFHECQGFERAPAFD